MVGAPASAGALVSDQFESLQKSRHLQQVQRAAVDPDAGCHGEHLEVLDSLRVQAAVQEVDISEAFDGLAVEEDAGFVGRLGVRHDLVSLGELLRFRLITFAPVALIV